MFESLEELRPNCEAHVLQSLDAVLDVLRRLEGRARTGDGGPIPDHARRLEQNAALLLGSLAAGRVTRVMVTLPTEAAADKTLVGELVGAGMDVARINCAHDSAADWKAMAEHVRGAGVAAGRPCRIAMDLAGPKLRTGPLPPGAAVLRVAPHRDSRGVARDVPRQPRDPPGRSAAGAGHHDVDGSARGVVAKPH